MTHMTMKRRIHLGITAGAILLALTALTSVPAPVSTAQSTNSALTGRVTSDAEGNMEGVLVSAKREGANMTISVVSNATGVYAFPKGRLEPGRYTVSVRAAGYVMP